MNIKIWSLVEQTSLRPLYECVIILRNNVGFLGGKMSQLGHLNGPASPGIFLYGKHYTIEDCTVEIIQAHSQRHHKRKKKTQTADITVRGGGKFPHTYS